MEREGTAVFQVRMPRTLCENALSLRMGVERFPHPIQQHGSGRRSSPGAPTRRRTRRRHRVRCRSPRITGCGWQTQPPGPDAIQMRRLLDSGIPLAKNVRRQGAAHRTASRTVSLRRARLEIHAQAQPTAGFGSERCTRQAATNGDSTIRLLAGRLVGLSRRRVSTVGYRVSSSMSRSCPCRLVRSPVMAGGMSCLEH